MKLARWVSYVAMVSVLSVSSAQIAFSSPGAEAGKASKNDKVAARVNGQEILNSEVMALGNSLPPQIREQAKDKSRLFAFLRDQLIDIRLVSQEAKNAKLENDPEVTAAFEKAKEQILLQAFLAKKLKDKVTEKAVRAAWEKENKDEEAAQKAAAEKGDKTAGIEVKARHILVKDEKTARTIIQKLKDGTDFMKLAREYSEDKNSAQNGGDIGWFRKGEMIPEFVDAAYALEPGKFSLEPVKTQFGYHIIKLDDRRKRKPGKFEDEAERIQAQLTEKEMAQLVQSLRSSATVERFDQNGKPAKALADEIAAPAASSAPAEAKK